jgi:tripartite-type tricarboxylate transporter receptor subunit TctC
MLRRHLMALAPTLAAAGAAQAQPASDRTLRIISSAPPGGASDVVARLLAEGLQAAMGQRVIVDNRVGAGGTIAAEAAARAAPDGQTLFMGIVSTQVITPAVRRVAYDAENGFAPIGLVSLAPMVLVVNPQLPANTLAELIALSVERRGALNFSNGGIATLPHLLHEMLARHTPLQAQPVPYSGSATALRAVISGEVAATFEVGVIVRGHVESGALRALAVTTRTRDPGFPNVPTMTELGHPQIAGGSWTALFAPAGTPEPVIATLSTHLNAIIRSEAFRARLTQLGAQAQGGSPAELAAFLAEERARWVPLARAFADRLN